MITGSPGRPMQVTASEKFEGSPVMMLGRTPFIPLDRAGFYQ
jgi:hypothetical protein